MDDRANLDSAHSDGTLFLKVELVLYETHMSAYGDLFQF